MESPVAFEVFKYTEISRAVVLRERLKVSKHLKFVYSVDAGYVFLDASGLIKAICFRGRGEQLNTLPGLHELCE